MKAKIKWYQEVLELEPSSKVFFPLARLFADSGRHTEALTTLRQGLERHPDHLEARLLLVEILRTLGDHEASYGQVENLADMMSGYPVFWEAWGEVLEKRRGERDPALAVHFLAEHFRETGITWTDVLERGMRSMLGRGPEDADTPDLPDTDGGVTEEDVDSAIGALPGQDDGGDFGDDFAADFSADFGADFDDAGEDDEDDLPDFILEDAPSLSGGLDMADEEDSADADADAEADVDGPDLVGVPPEVAAAINDIDMDGMDLDAEDADDSLDADDGGADAFGADEGQGDDLASMADALLAGPGDEAEDFDLEPLNDVADGAEGEIADTLRASGDMDDGEDGDEEDDEDEDDLDDLDVEEEGFSLRTKTMAHLLADQGDYDGAIDIYEELMENAKTDEARMDLAARIETLREQQAASGGNGDAAPTGSAGEDGAGGSDDVSEDGSDDDGGEGSVLGGKHKLITTLEALAKRLETRAAD